MDEDELDAFERKMGEPGPEEEEFFARRRALGLGIGLDEGRRLVKQKGPVFLDFEASSLSKASWPIEVGISWLECGKVIVHNRLIKPRSEWPESDWNPQSAKVHGILRSELDGADSADDVSKWLLEAVGGRVLVSDAVAFDQIWLNRLLDDEGPVIREFDQLAWIAFSDNGLVSPGRLHKVFNNLAQRKIKHRAGDDAANLAYAWRAGVGK